MTLLTLTSNQREREGRRGSQSPPKCTEQEIAEDRKTEGSKLR
jgi:hypothetical protein